MTATAPRTTSSFNVGIEHQCEPACFLSYSLLAENQKPSGNINSKLMVRNLAWHWHQVEERLRRKGWFADNRSGNLCATPEKGTNLAFKNVCVKSWVCLLSTAWSWACVYYSYHITLLGFCKDWRKYISNTLYHPWEVCVVLN